MFNKFSLLHKFNSITSNRSKFLSNFNKMKAFQFSANTQPEMTPVQLEKTMMKRLYSKKIDDSIIANYLKTIIKENTALIAYKGDIRMDYLAKCLNEYKIGVTVIALDLNPVLDEAFKHFYPFVIKSKYLLFLKGKLVDTDDFTHHLNSGTAEQYLKSYNII